jgi:hypothetical protein
MRSMKLKESRALTILVGWLDAVKVPYRLDQAADRDLTVGEIPVKIVVDQPTAGTAIRADDLTAPLDKALKVFWTVTEAAGYGRPQPVDRGARRCMRCHQELTDEKICPNPDCGTTRPDRVKSEDAPELVAIRHREFRQVANLPASVYADDDYRRIMEWYCHKFYRNNLRLCQNMAFDVSDLETYAMIYLTNFHGRWRKINAKKGENGKMLCSYLQQRFYSDLLPLLRRKAANILVDEETIDLGLDIHHVRQYGEGGEMSLCAVKNESEVDVWSEVEDLDHDELLRTLRHQFIAGYESDIRSAARKMLGQHWTTCQACDPMKFSSDLRKFPHSEFISIITMLADSNRETVRTGARGELKVHRLDCQTCSPTNIIDTFFVSLPDLLECRKCHLELPKADIGVRVMERDDAGRPKYVKRQSYCKPCRSKKSSPTGDATRVQVNENHPGADRLGTQPGTASSLQV